MITAIVCVDRNWAIGKNNGLLFNLKADMAHFRETTKNRVVVMGYNTLLSFPNSKPLKNRTNIVLCPEGIEPKGCIVYHDFNKMVHDVQLLSATNEVFVIGGGMLYNSMLPYYDKAIITKVDAEDNDATVFFPNLDEQPEFKLCWETQPQVEAGLSFSICTYNKQRGSTVKYVNKKDIVEAVEFTGFNYGAIYRAWPNSDVVLTDGEHMPLKTWVVDLGGFSPFDENPSYIIIKHEEDPHSDCLYAHDWLVLDAKATKPKCFTAEEFKANYELLNAN